MPRIVLASLSNAKIENIPPLAGTPILLEDRSLLDGAHRGCVRGGEGPPSVGYGGGMNKVNLLLEPDRVSRN